MKRYVYSSRNEEDKVLRQIHDQLVILSRLLESDEISPETGEALRLDKFYVEVIDLIQDTYR